MTQLGTLSGIGKLWDGNKDLGAVDYVIRVFRVDGLKHGEGMLQGNAHLLWDGFQAGQSLMLMLRSGEQVSLTIKSVGNDGADILTSGAIPDPVPEFDSTD